MNRRAEFVVRHVRPYWLQFSAILAAILITTLLVAMYPWLFGKIIDSLFYQKELPAFLSIAGIYCAVFFVNQLLHFFLNMTIARLRGKYLLDIKRDIFRKVLSFKSERLSSLNSGDVIYRINHDADETLNFIITDVFYGLSALLDFVTCLGMMAYINLYFAGMSLLLAVLTFLLSKHFSNKLKPLYRATARLASANKSWLYEILGAMRDIKLLMAVKYCVRRYFARDIGIIRADNNKIRQAVLAERCNAAMQLVNTLCIFILAAFFIAAGSLTIGGLMACLDYFNRITLMLTRLYGRAFTIHERMISVDRILAIENEQSEPPRSVRAEREILRGDIRFSNVVFSYDKVTTILNGATLHIKAGEKIALVGKSGAGKSTIAELLCGLYAADGGEIAIDDVDISDYNLQDLRRHVGLVHQDSAVFNASVRYNLIFSDSREYDGKIWAVLKQVRLDEIVRALPDGLDTILDSVAVALSGGQKQRLAIARMYLKNPRVLIFDESTAALDGKTELEITEAWSDLFEGRTMLIIAHRFSTILKADRVAYLENGKIAGFDRHSQLVESCAPYRKLFLAQYPDGEDKARD